MNENISILVRLQGFDDEIASLSVSMSSLPADVMKLIKKRDMEVSSLDELHSQKSDILKQIADLDNKITHNSSIYDNAQIKKSNVKNNKEYEAIIREVDSLEKVILTDTESRDNLQLKLDEINVQDDSLSKAITEANSIIEEGTQKYNASLGDVRSRFESVTKMREDLVKNCPPPLFSKYTRLSKKFKNAVVQISNESCSGCAIRMTSQDFVEVIKGEVVKNCPHCGRYLYYGDS